MREIKFRAWNESANRYSKPFTIRFGVLNFTDDDGLGVVKSLTDEVVEQFTGLKDKGGVDIYEGDLVKKSGDIYEVVFSKKAAKFCVRMPSRQWHGVVNKVYSISGCEVIGNIHLNAELLNDKTN